MIDPRRAWFQQQIVRLHRYRSRLRWNWIQEWKPALREWWWWRGRFLVLLILLAVLLVAVLANGWIGLVDRDALRRLHPLLLTAGVFLVSLPGAYLVSRHFEFRSQQSDRLERYWSLQQKFNRYQSAFWELRRALERHYSVDGQFGRDYDDLRRNLDFWEDPEVNRPMAVMFVRDLWEVSQHHWDVADPTVWERLISPGWLAHLHECTGRLTGVLGRSKYYGPLLEQLGAPLSPGGDFHSHAIVPHNWVRILERLDLVREKEGDPSTLGYWDERFTEAYELLDEMMTHGLYVFGGPPRSIRAIMRELCLLTLVAVVVPLGLMSFRVPAAMELRMTYFAILGFFVALYLIGATLYTEVLWSSVIRDRRATQREA